MKLEVNFKRGWSRKRLPGDRRLWLLWSIGLRIHLGANPLWEFVIYWQRLAAFTGALLVAGYLGLVTAVHYRWRQLPENQVTWLDLANAPWRWSELRRKRGETSIALGLKQLEAKKYAEALFNLRAGLARAPENMKGRAALVELLAAFGEPKEAFRVVEEGRRIDPQAEALIQMTLGFFSGTRSWQRMIEFTDEMLAANRRPPLDDTLRQRLVNQRADALLQLGRVEEAVNYLAQQPGQPGTPGRRDALRLRVIGLLRLGRGAEAQALFDAEGGRDAARSGPPHVELAIAKELGDVAGVETALRQLKASDELGVDSLLIAYQTWQEMGRSTLRDGAEHEIIMFHRDKEFVLQRFSKLLVELDNLPALERLRLTAMGRGMNTFAFDVGITEILLRRGAFADAQRRVVQWEGLLSALPTGQRNFPELVRRTVRAAALGGSGDGTALLAQLETMRGSAGPQIYLRTISTLEAAGRPALALDVARLGLRRLDTTDELIAVEARLAREAAASLAVAKPAEAAAPEPVDETNALSALDAALARQDLSAAQSLLRAWKSAHAAPTREDERVFGLREIRLALLQQDGPAVRQLVRRYLERQVAAEDALTVLALAAEVGAAGKSGAVTAAQAEVAAVRLNVPEVAAALSAQGYSGDSGSLASAEAARRALSDAFARQDYDKAAQLVRSVRRAAPDWLGEVAPELAFAEVRARALGGQIPAASLALRELIQRAAVMKPQAYDFIRQLARDGRHEAAKALLDEAVRLRGSDEEVIALRAEVAQLLSTKR